jgi:hypothetical protein
MLRRGASINDNAKARFISINDNAKARFMSSSSSSLFSCTGGASCSGVSVGTLELVQDNSELTVLESALVDSARDKAIARSNCWSSYSGFVTFGSDC